MTIKSKTIEERVSGLEREVAMLKAAAESRMDAAPGPGFAEEGQPTLEAAAPDPADLERRIVHLEATVTQLKTSLGHPGPKDWRRTVGWAKEDPGYDEAMRLGAEWRRRENLKSIRELDRRGEIDADPGHRSPQRPGSRRKTSRKAAGTI